MGKPNWIASSWALRGDNEWEDTDIWDLVRSATWAEFFCLWRNFKLIVDTGISLWLILPFYQVDIERLVFSQYNILVLFLTGGRSGVICNNNLTNAIPKSELAFQPDLMKQGKIWTLPIQRYLLVRGAFFRICMSEASLRFGKENK